MHTFNADRAWAAVTAADPALLDRDGLARLLASIERVRAVCAAVEVVAVRRSRALADCGTGEPAENLLVSATGSSSRQAHLAAGREQACEAMPAIEFALSNGLLSAAHVDAAAGVHGRLGPDVAAAFADHAPDLAQRASTLPVDMFERECRDLARHLQQRADTDAEVAELERRQRASTVTRWVDRSTGMHKTLIRLDLLRDSRMWKAISAEVARERRTRCDHNQPSLPFAELQAAAAVTAVTTERADSSAQRVPEVGVFVDLDTLKGLATEGGIVCEADDGTPLPITTVRRLCCDGAHHPHRARERWCRTRPRPTSPHCHSRPTHRNRRDASQLRVPRLHRERHRLPGPSHPLVVEPSRHHRPRQLDSPVRTASPPRSRGAVEPHHDR
jgi:hypothetical protein